jgi:chemotaxis protein MotB
MRKTTTPVIGLALLSAFSCVKPKIYRAELAARAAAEGREKTLVQEVAERRQESASLIQKVGDLSRQVGNQESEIRELKSELANRTQAMGESSSKLASEKMALEKQLAATSEQLDDRTAALQRVKKAQGQRAATLNALADVLTKSYDSQQDLGVKVAIEGETVSLTLPDKSLFEPTGLALSATGKTLLVPLAEFLAARPALDVDIVAHTDNVLPPKEKSLKDTWDWSLQRATNVVRVLVREFNTNANQMTPVGKGEFYPLSSNETPEGRQKNRRTVVVLRPNLAAIPAAE